MIPSFVVDVFHRLDVPPCFVHIVVTGLCCRYLLYGLILTSARRISEPFLQFVGKGCGFVLFADRKNAEDAIQAVNGTVIGKQRISMFELP
ncbi:hypothetical protein PHAVU_003G294500 [Phaseolus vulgaris]|uniref:RRM domain-containing protein n=1 Tax=Phaseolus vulgaris TaxID=3885 RepID=V7CE99_PHAVU|nr:hypothetical protein PHAVU_003G294500g [Phaseolus vulgaris]ESW28532.1 hypothetical protein PHAVU_003G294500g [Phaseolus vulgaris]